VRFLAREDGGRLAYVARPGAGPTVVFLGGYASDMTGTKARYLEDWCRARGRAFLRFDYQGHGQSSGRLIDGTIGAWRDDALAILGACAPGPLLLVGSSMGAWVMVLAALALPRRLHALVAVAAAPDFTEDLLWARLDEAQRSALRRDGVIRLPSAYGEPMPFTWRLVEDGRRHLVLRAPLSLPCPVRLLHGTRDADVPWETSRRLADAIRGRDVALTLVKDGEHRLSEPHELALLGATIEGLL
jgi:pimeloyl-ACP methyl ester carboxylesterase